MMSANAAFSFQALGPPMSDQQPNVEPGFSSLEAVRRFLNGQGYAVTKSTIDRHKKDGKIKPNPSGLFTEAAALKYASSFLREKETGLRKAEGAALQQNVLVGARTDLLREQALLAKHKREVEEGKYVLRSAVSQDLAARAVMLKTGLKQLTTSGVSDWVHLVAGDPRRAPELQRAIMEGLERVLDDYARADGVVLDFSGPEEDVVDEEEVASAQV